MCGYRGGGYKPPAKFKFPSLNSIIKCQNYAFDLPWPSQITVGQPPTPAEKFSGSAHAVHFLSKGEIMKSEDKVKCLKICFPRTPGLISTKLCTQHPCDFRVCSNEGPFSYCNYTEVAISARTIRLAVRSP